MKKLLLLILVLFLAGMLVFAAGKSDSAGPSSGSFPSKTIRWIVPSGAGGTVDLQTRALADLLKIGQSVVVENIPGGGMTIGSAEVAAKPGDGHTWISMANACIASPLMTKVTYKFSDFRHIAMLAPLVQATICVRKDSPLNNIEDFLALVKSGKPFKYGIPSMGGYCHLAIAHVMNQLGRLEDPNAKMVAYTATPEVIMSLLNGETDFILIDHTDAYQRKQNGEMKVIAIIHDEPCSLLPDVKKISDYGIKGMGVFAGYKWLAVRKDVPEPIVTRIKQEVNKAILQKEYQDFNIKMGFGPMRVYSEEETSKIILTAEKDYEVVLKASGLIN